jgi:hypothetical protein
VYNRNRVAPLTYGSDPANFDGSVKSDLVERSGQGRHPERLTDRTYCAGFRCREAALVPDMGTGGQALGCSA